ncbi:MAG: glycoside hydrolase family 25 protein [Tenuifilaceae bacterium]
MSTQNKNKVIKSSSFTDLINKLLIASIVVGAVGMIGYKFIFGPDPFELDRNKYPILGIDVSRHNGKINWEEIKNLNIEFVFIKATEGKTMIDPWFKKNFTAVKKANIKVGAYHFFKFNRDGAEQARNFLSQTKKLRLDFPPILDIEEYTNTRIKKSQKEVVREIRKFISTVEASTGRKVLLYMNEHDYNKYIKDNFNNNPLWICSLDEEPNIDRDWKFWQYTHRGKLDGLKGLFDLNTFNGDRGDWNKYIKSVSR